MSSIREFQATLSRREYDPSGLHWWTSEKRGGSLRDWKSTVHALELWALKHDMEETESVLANEGYMSRDRARNLCQDLDKNAGLWQAHGFGVVVPRPDLSVSNTEGRPYEKSDDDGFRDSFQRDRDRITWSRGLRQLATKTQVFPIGSADYLRNRLAHSLEVMQLASTIGANFELNLSLIEAGALAHDIGHTPFGHAGEHALDSLFREVKEDLGFSHYEHGVDVIRWLEDAYQSPAFGGLFGLNITSEVAECVFKHTYCQTGGSFCQDELYKQSKHQDYFGRDLCHLEGQAVRIADKVSYLVSDLEDGILMGAIKLDDLLDCTLLRRTPVDLVVAPGESPFERFLSQRSVIVGIVMEDIIEATAERLSRIRTLEQVRMADTYTVDVSDIVKKEVEEIWNRLQVGRLHADGRVRIANIRAARIVRELAILFAVAPQLIDDRFRVGHERLHGSSYIRFYRGITGPKVKLRKEHICFLGSDHGVALGFSPGKDPEVPIEHLIQAKDFVAGLSDERARRLHREMLG